MTSAPAASGKVTLSEASPADLDDVARLLSLRDDQPRDRGLVSDYLWGLEPDAARAWIARVDGEPAGLTMLYLRRMKWPVAEGATDEGDELTAGYWAHLYVRPEFRSKMIYPQLVLAMFRGMGAAGIRVIFTATRQPTVADAHQKLGFALVGKLPLWLKPLRPFRLVAKHKSLGWAAPLGWPLDALYWEGTARPRRTDVRVESVPLSAPAIDEIVQLLNERATPAVRQIWTPEQFRRRYRITLDGTPYRITAVRRDNRLIAAAVTTLAERGNKIRAGILLELVASPAAAPADVNALLDEARSFARAGGADLMLSLDGSLSAPQLAGSHAKYTATRSEQYHLLVYPKNMAQSPYAAAKLENWQFAFGDHDAF